MKIPQIKSTICLEGIIYFFIFVTVLFTFRFFTDYFNWQTVQHLAAGIFCTIALGGLIKSLNSSLPFKQNIVLTATLVTFLLFVSESILKILINSKTQKNDITALIKSGVPFDQRSLFEIVKDYKKEGKHYFTAVQTGSFKRLFGKPLLVNGKEYVAFGGVANADVILCNELGYYASYSSDYLGFNNPPQVWLSNIKIAFLGDSFVHGHCLKPGDSFVDLVRKPIPQTVNLGFANNGPLSEWAAYKEYLATKKVDFVFWVYYEGNDLHNLNVELSHPVLKHYLKDDFTQRLHHRQEQLNAAVRKIMLEEMEKELNKPTTETLERLSFKLNQLWHHPIATLFPNIYSRFKDTYRFLSLSQKYLYRLDAFETILTRVKNKVKSNEGNLIFMYLPAFERYDGRIKPQMEMKKEILRIVTKLNIPFIDVDQLFSRSQDPKSFFPFRLKGHYNPQGNSIIAQKILEMLIKDYAFQYSIPKGT